MIQIVDHMRELRCTKVSIRGLQLRPLSLRHKNIPLTFQTQCRLVTQLHDIAETSKQSTPCTPQTNLYRSLKCSRGTITGIDQSARHSNQRGGFLKGSIQRIDEQ